MCGFDAVGLGIFLVWTILAGWIMFLGGAEWAEDSWLGGVLLAIGFDIFPGTPATVIKVLVGVVWGGTVALAALLC